MSDGSDAEGPKEHLDGADPKPTSPDDKDMGSGDENPHHTEKTPKNSVKKSNVVSISGSDMTIDSASKSTAKDAAGGPYAVPHVLHDLITETDSTARTIEKI